MFLRIGHETALLDLALSHFKLRLDQTKYFRCRLLNWLQRWQNECQRNEGKVQSDEVDSFADVLEPQMAGIETFNDYDSPVTAELPVELIVANIQGIDLCGSSLQKTICKSSRGGSNVQAGPALHIWGIQIQRFFELEAGSGYIRRREMFKSNSGGDVNSRPRLVDAVVIDQDGAFEDQSLGLLAGFDKATIEKNLVNALLVTLGSRAVQFFGCTVNS